MTPIRLERLRPDARGAVHVMRCTTKPNFGAQDPPLESTCQSIVLALHSAAFFAPVLVFDEVVDRMVVVEARWAWEPLDRVLMLDFFVSPFAGWAEVLALAVTIDLTHGITET